MRERVEANAHGAGRGASARRRCAGRELDTRARLAEIYFRRSRARRRCVGAITYVGGAAQTLGTPHSRTPRRARRGAWEALRVRDEAYARWRTNFFRAAGTSSIAIRPALARRHPTRRSHDSGSATVRTSGGPTPSSTRLAAALCDLRKRTRRVAPAPLARAPRTAAEPTSRARRGGRSLRRAVQACRLRSACAITATRCSSSSPAPGWP